MENIQQIVKQYNHNLSQKIVQKVKEEDNVVACSCPDCTGISK